MPDLYSNIHLLVRWLHVIAGITWIGHLYFFNFVNLPLQAALDDPSKKILNPQLMPRALWWFRWGAMITLLAGIVLFVMVYFYTPGVGFGPTALFMDAQGLTGRGAWILLGMGLALIMWVNVWMIIWPTQKKLLTGKVPADEIPAARKKAALASRINTYLSAPMLFAMLAPSHYGTMHPVALVGAIVIAEAAIWKAYQASTAVGKLS
jgi:uncharacterized membrane protein